MSVTCVELGSGERHRAPVSGGPIAEILLGKEPGRQMGVVEVTVPACGLMPLHEHGTSETLLIPLHGAVRLISGGDDGELTMLEPGTLVVIPVGEKVRLENPEGEAGKLLVVFSPVEFTERIAAWPREMVPVAA